MASGTSAEPRRESQAINLPHTSRIQTTDASMPKNRGHPRGDARRPSPAGVPRQLRPPPHPPQPVPSRDVVRSLEVHRTLQARSRHCRCPHTHALSLSGKLELGYIHTHPLGANGDAIDEQQADVEQDERHSYEKCQYVEFKKRVAKMDELRESKGGERSN
jgi:hypothetical protein